MSDQVHSITDAPQKHSDEQHGRMVRYAVSMGIRMACFILAVLLQNWMTWVLLALAAVLPYIAVTLANAGGDRYMRGSESENPAAALLTAAEDSAPAPQDRQWWEDEDLEQAPSPDRGQAEVISGQLVSDQVISGQTDSNPVVPGQESPRTPPRGSVQDRDSAA